MILPTESSSDKLMQDQHVHLFACSIMIGAKCYDEGAVAQMCRRRSAQRRPPTYFLQLLSRCFSKHLQIEI